jgi:hypothetical protein
MPDVENTGDAYFLRGQRFLTVVNATGGVDGENGCGDQQEAGQDDGAHGSLEAEDFQAMGFVVSGKGC